MKAKHAKPVESNRNVYITVLVDRAVKQGILGDEMMDLHRAALDKLTDAELLLLVQVGRELQSA